MAVQAALDWRCRLRCRHSYIYTCQVSQREGKELQPGHSNLMVHHCQIMIRLALLNVSKESCSTQLKVRMWLRVLFIAAIVIACTQEMLLMTD